MNDQADAPLTVTCDTCGKSAGTWNGADPDSALECGCCPVRHDHAGLGCRTVTITARMTAQEGAPRHGLL